MEEDEIVVDEPIVEEQEIIEEEVEEETNDSPTLEDYNRLKKERETLLAQKNHWKKKAEGSKEIEQKPLIKENNKTQSSSLTREEAILFAKGYTEEEVDLANKLAKVNGIGILEAVEDDYLKNKRALRLKNEMSNKASLPASNGVGKFKAEKPVGEMSKDEHKAYFDKVMGN